jgi:hypothetical protein
MAYKSRQRNLEEAGLAVGGCGLFVRAWMLDEVAQTIGHQLAGQMMTGLVPVARSKLRIGKAVQKNMMRIGK